MAPPLDSPHAVAPGMFAARANRINLVNAFTVVVLVVLAWSAWPTDAKRLQMRAAEYVEAAKRGDAAATYQFIAPAARRRMPLDVWAARKSPRHEIASVVVDDSADHAVVTLTEEISRRQVATAWIKVDRIWYYDIPEK